MKNNFVKNLSNKQPTKDITHDDIKYKIPKITSKNKISVKRLIQNPTVNKKNASIIIITHEAKSSSFAKALSELKKKNYIVSTPKIIRIEKI